MRDDLDFADTEGLRRAVLRIAKAVNETTFAVRLLKRQLESERDVFGPRGFEASEVERFLDGATNALTDALNELDAADARK